MKPHDPHLPSLSDCRGRARERETQRHEVGPAARHAVETLVAVALAEAVADRDVTGVERHGSISPHRAPGPVHGLSARATDKLVQPSLCSSMEEQFRPKERVGGSSPSRGTNVFGCRRCWLSSAKRVSKPGDTRTHSFSWVAPRTARVPGPQSAAMRPWDASAAVTAHRGGGTAGASSPSRGTKG